MPYNNIFGHEQCRVIKRYRKALRRQGVNVTIEQAACKWIKGPLRAIWRKKMDSQEEHD
jgi:hypothetical protein